MNKILIIYILITATSCSFFKSAEEPNFLKSYEKVTTEDYLDFYKSLGPVYRNFNNNKVIEIRGSNRRYLYNIYKKLKRNNELLLAKDVTPKFYIIISNRPIYFSLPGGQYYLSTGLLKKYLKNEDLLIAVMAAETIRWQRGLYPRTFKVPIGYISTKEILDMIRLPLKIKVDFNKWTYNVIKRSGVDASVYLNWLQLQNKNILDFSMLLGDVNGMAKEEFLFKDFLIKIDIFETGNKIERSSGEGFYRLQNRIRSIYETRKI